MISVFRPRLSRQLSVACFVLCAAALVYALVTDGAGALWTSGTWAALVAATVWATFYRPEVRISPGGVRLVNVFRTIDLPWPAIQLIDTKWALALRTGYGTFTAWAAPAPGRRETRRLATKDVTTLPESTYADGESIRPGDAPDTSSGAAALLIRRQWEQLRDAGHLDDSKLDPALRPVTWFLPTVVGLPLLLTLAVLSAVTA